MTSSETESFLNETEVPLSQSDLDIDEEWDTVHPGIRNLENNEDTVNFAEMNETGQQPLSMWHEVMDVNKHLLLEKEALQAEKRTLEQEISILKREKFEIEQKQTLEAEIRRLQQEMAILTQHKCNAEEKERQAMQVNEALQEEVQELQALVQRQKQLRERLEEAEAVHSFDELLMEGLKEQVSSLRGKIRELEQQLQNEESSIAGNENLGSEPDRLSLRVRFVRLFIPGWRRRYSSNETVEFTEPAEQNQRGGTVEVQRRLANICRGRFRRESVSAFTNSGAVFQRGCSCIATSAHCSCLQIKMATDVLTEQYNKLQEENEQFKQLIDQQKDQVDALDKEIVVAKSRIQEKYTFPGGILKHEGKRKHHLRLIHILENKLNQDTMKFDELLCGNMDYREDIPHLLQQKGIACSIEEKFNRQLAEQQSMIEEMGERSTIALNHSLEAEAQMLEVKERMQVETAQFTKRRMHLRTVIDHEVKRQSFMERKLKEIIPTEDDDDSKKKKRLQQYEDEAERLEMYMQGYSRLVEVSGETDVHQIGRMFIQTEQRNFAHINFINELHNRSNMLSNRTDKIKKDILILEQENKWDHEKRKRQLRGLEAELEKYSCLVDSLENQCAVFQRSLEQLREANSELLEAISVTSDNRTDFSSILEDSISNLLIQANNVEDGQTDSPFQSLLLVNSELLPERQVTVEMDHGRTPSRSLKSS